ncbi:LysR family transcriptional regulator [Aquincola sp. J276]|uniref:LysR family transcriptional regulator n=1 Tax=Aquincola sp. J276 TaxID=2898432 RepID=UPI002150FF59|nr:LysR substrate-binding domain-containing protein [Aquincola sp. J276]MCR5867760.1 LysR substrate-binding domain-containing protein [Aquincola sp. J276]
MDLRDLRYFETIAELQHVGKAAERLHRTQPALTGAVRRLEQQAGAPLFERSGRGIRLTDAGRVLLRWAQRLRFDVEDARREIAEIGRGVAGHARIGIVPTAAQYLLPQAVRQLLQEAPEVTLSTTVALVDVLLPMLGRGELDLVVGTEGRAQPGLQSHRLSEDSIVVAAHARHEIFQGKPTLKDLTRYRWVLQAPGAPTRDWLDHTFDRKRLPRPVVQVESSMLVTLPAMIAETGLLSFISRHHLAAGSPQRLREVVLKETTMRRRLVVTHRSHAYVPPAARRLMELLAAAAASPVAEGEA